MLRARALALVGALLALGSAAPAEAVTGEQRVLVVLATWGPTPFQAADVRRVVFAEADAFLRKSSFGKVGLRGEVTSWLRVLPPTAGCPDDWWEEGIPRAVSGPARAGATSSGHRLSDYDRVVYLVPGSRCAFIGLGWETEVLLNGILDSDLVVHELGHTWGLGHAGSAPCADECSLDDVGDPFSPMGRGSTDFSVYEKFVLGWVKNVASASRPGVVKIGRADAAGRLPYALRVETALGAYWLEYRPDSGVFVRYVNGQRDEGPFANVPVLMTRPSVRDRPFVVPGEDAAVRGVFAARFVRREGNGAVLRFRWADKLGPRAPLITAPREFGPVGSTVRVRWEAPFERGSGIVSYSVAVDGAKAVVVKENEITLSGLSNGAHFVSVWAVDRAGNRGLAAVRRFEVG